MWVILFVLAVMGCSSASRRPSVAILISMRGGSVPSPAELAYIYSVVRPEIEKLGYAVAKNTTSADFVVYITDPVNPLGGSGGRLRLEQAETYSLDRLAAASGDFKRDSDRATGEMVREPKE